jgi:PAS domain S-box-containing protein
VKREVQTETPAADVKRLQHCLNDLGVLLELPVWDGNDAPRIGPTLLAELVEVLRADFAYLRLNESVSGSATEWARSRVRGEVPPSEIGHLLEAATVRFRLGLREEIGHLIVGAQRAGFPTMTERLVIQVAVNQATIALQEARLAREEHRVQEWLEDRVSERTEALTARIDELKKEMLERARVEADLKTSEQRHVLATTAAGLGVWDWNLSTSEIHVDGALKRTLGFEDHEIGDDLESWASHVHPDDLALMRTRAESVIEGRVPVGELELRMLHKDGSVRWFFARGTVVRSSDGRPERMLGTGTEITECKAAQARVQTIRDELTRISRLTALGRFAASIAHEVSQPLSSILMDSRACLRMLQASSPRIDEISAAIHDIADATHRANEIMRRHRASIESHGAETAHVRINDVVQDVLSLVEGRLQQGGISIALTLRDVPAVIGDRVGLLQVVLSLVLNAIEALEDVEGRARLITIDSSVMADGSVQVSVGDNGIGLDNVDWKRLFAVAYTTKRSRAGLGLATSRATVEAHGGRMWAAPNHPRGAAFAFAIPPAGPHDVDRPVTAAS